MKNRSLVRRWGGTLAIVAASLGAVGGGVWFYNDVVKEYYLATRWGVVEPGQIYRSGSLPPMRARALLADHDIQVICKLTGEEPGVWHHEEEREAAADLGIELDLIPMPGDGTGDVASYVEAIATVDAAVQAGQPVLVHCASGTNRTGGVIAAYRTLVEGVDPDLAYAEMRQYKFDPAQNTELLPHLNALLPSIAAGLVERGVISTVPDPMPQLGM